MLRVVICQYLYDLSDRWMEEALTFDVAMKYFASLAPDERGIDYSTLLRFRAWVGAARFKLLFNIRTLIDGSPSTPKRLDNEGHRLSGSETQRISNTSFVSHQAQIECSPSKL